MEYTLATPDGTLRLIGRRAPKMCVRVCIDAHFDIRNLGSCSPIEEPQCEAALPIDRDFAVRASWRIRQLRVPRMGESTQGRRERDGNESLTVGNFGPGRPVADALRAQPRPQNALDPHLER